MSPLLPRLPLIHAGPLPRWRSFLGLLLLVGFSSLRADEDPPGSPATAGRRVEPPVAVRTVQPVHPPELQKNLVNGDAVIDGLVDADGHVSATEVVTATQPEFGQAAAEALRQWEFKPGTVDGQPAPQRVRVPFEFRLSTGQVLSAIAGRPVYREVDETVIPASQLPAWPRPIQFYTPRYPKELEGSGKYGKAVVNITIDKEGQVINPRIVKSTYPEFIVPAMVTALQLRFPPQVMADRKVIHVSMDIQFDFKVPEKDKARPKGGAN